MNIKIEKEDEAWAINQKLMAKLHLQTVKFQQIEEENETYKLMIDEIGSLLGDPVKLKELISDFEVSSENDNKAEIEKLLKTKEEQLEKVLKAKEKELAMLRKSQKEELEKLRKANEDEIESWKTAKQGADFIIENIKRSKDIVHQELEEIKAKKEAIENENATLKASVMNLSLDVFTLKNEKEKVEANAQEMKKLQDEIAILKLDLKDKCENYDKLAEQHETFKLEVEKHECSNKNDGQLSLQPPPGMVAVKMAAGSIVSANVFDLNFRLNDLANRCNMVTQDRNRLWTRLMECENYYSELVSRQQKEIFHLKSSLNEAHVKIMTMKTQHSIDEIAWKCKKIQEDFEQTKKIMNESRI